MNPKARFTLSTTRGRKWFFLSSAIFTIIILILLTFNSTFSVVMATAETNKTIMLNDVGQSNPEFGFYVDVSQITIDGLKNFSEFFDDLEQVGVQQHFIPYIQASLYGEYKITFQFASKNLTMLFTGISNTVSEWLIKNQDFIGNLSNIVFFDSNYLDETL